MNLLHRPYIAPTLIAEAFADEQMARALRGEFRPARHVEIGARSNRLAIFAVMLCLAVISYFAWQLLLRGGL